MYDWHVIIKKKRPQKEGCKGEMNKYRAVNQKYSTGTQNMST
jgi:hypothetical protein